MDTQFAAANTQSPLSGTFFSHLSDNTGVVVPFERDGAQEGKVAVSWSQRVGGRRCGLGDRSILVRHMRGHYQYLCQKDGIEHAANCSGLDGVRLLWASREGPDCSNVLRKVQEKMEGDGLGIMVEDAWREVMHETAEEENSRVTAPSIVNVDRLASKLARVATLVAADGASARSPPSIKQKNRRARSSTERAEALDVKYKRETVMSAALLQMLLDPTYAFQVTIQKNRTVTYGCPSPEQAARLSRTQTGAGGCDVLASLTNPPALKV